MKSVGVFIISTVVLFSLFYLMGAFTQNSFNISYWTIGARGIVGTLGGLVSVAVGLLSAANYEEKEQPKK